MTRFNCLTLAALFLLVASTSRAEEKREKVTSADAVIEIEIGDGVLDLGNILKALSSKTKTDVGNKVKEGKESAEKNGKPEADVTVTGKAIVIGPDGKRRTMDLKAKDGKLNLNKVLEGLPEGARKEVEKAMRGLGSAKVDSKVISRAYVIGADGKPTRIDLGSVKSGEFRRAHGDQFDGKPLIAVPKSNRLEQKLDMILERLDRLEKKISGLKAN